MNNIIKDVINVLNENKSVLWKAYEADKTDFEYKYTKLIKIVESYKNSKIDTKNFGAICYTDGNPYITIHLCMQAILSNSIIMICNQNNMNNLNNVIVDIFKEISPKSLRLENRITMDKLYLFTENNREQIIVYNDKKRYEKIKKFNIPVIYKELDI